MKQDKEALYVIKKFTQLCKTYPEFENEFMEFFENLITEYRNKNIEGPEVDIKLGEFMINYTKRIRDAKLDSILRKKE